MKKRGWMFLLIPPAMVFFAYIFGEIVMHLWNWLLPSLFGWHAITFWQGLGLLVLCRILFGGFGGHGKERSNWRRERGAHWERMTPEEREKFRQEMRARWCRVGAPTSERGERGESGETA